MTCILGLGHILVFFFLSSSSLQKLKMILVYFW